MQTRYVYACEPAVYHRNGLKVNRRDLPSITATKYFINGILGELFTKLNPIGKHTCNSLCGQVVQLYIGFPHSAEVKGSVPANTRQMVAQYEDLLSLMIFNKEEEVELQSLGLRFLPCPKYLEIISVAMYM